MNDTAPKANPEMLPPLPEPLIFSNYFTADQLRAVQQEAYQLGYSAAREWKLISEAPKDGTRLLLVGVLGYDPGIGEWSESKQRWVTEEGQPWGVASHFQYLPEPPQ